MKNKILLLLACMFCVPLFSSAGNFVNLTPVPKQQTIGTGELELPQSFKVSGMNLPDDMMREVDKFVASLNLATSLSVASTTDDTTALFRVSKSTTPLDEEGYQIEITAKQVSIEASHAAGLYYAFQSIKKVLPPNVMAGVRDSNVTRYSLPIMSIKDSPRFGYRGFMLDVSRHFFPVEEIKRVIDVMSYYKMNRFHWHLTDDQGWRVEIKKYPRLTSIGSISDNSYVVDMQHGDYWINRPYGPYYYTQDELRDVVAYAREHHIEIIPEVDMPGHFSAAMASYPEYSCWPDGSHSVVSNIGGVYADVMNVANPEAVQFAKDILTELMDIFPYEYIHIGGDECPTTAWENNEACKARMKELGLKHPRELQSRFIQEMAEHLKNNGRKIAVWNEAISVQGADTRLIQETDATIFCWTGADGAVAKSAQLGLNHIYTPQVPYYINRKQSTDANEPVGAGKGTDNLEVVYKQKIPVPSGNASTYFSGVQATFWSEYVAFPDYLEYLILPRLVAIAEAGWSTESNKDFAHFCKRITADSTLYNYNNYCYGRHYMTTDSGDGGHEKVMPQVSTSTQRYWYRLVTQATDARADKCIELLSEGSSLIGTNNARAGRLWTNVQADEQAANYDYQWWCLEEDASAPGKYALVCKAKPNGSVKPTPTAMNNSGRWDYDENGKYYSFILADNGYGPTNEDYYYSIRSDQANGLWLNASLGGQGFAVNLYNKPSDGNGGLWAFVPQQRKADDTSLSTLLQTIRPWLRHVKTYTDANDRQPGCFGATETAALQALIADAQPDNLTAEEVQQLVEQINNAFLQFRQSFGYLEQGKCYRISNTIAPFKGSAFIDATRPLLSHSQDPWADDLWTVTASTINDDFTQTVQLQNRQSTRYIGAPADNATGRAGYGVTMHTSAADIQCTFDPDYQDFVLTIQGKTLFPIDEHSTSLPGAISSDTHAIRPMGNAWTITEAQPVTFHCIDENGRSLGDYHRSWPVHAEAGTQPVPPEIAHFLFVKKENDNYIYRRVSYTVTTRYTDTTGALIAVTDTTLQADTPYHVIIPDFPYYTFVSTTVADGSTLTAAEDQLIEVCYRTEAYLGVKTLGNAVTEVQPGHSYVIYDTSPKDTERKGFRNVNEHQEIFKTNRIEDTDPAHTWLLESNAAWYRVKNVYYQGYVPQLTTTAKPVKLQKSGGNYQFILNADGITWTIKGSNGVCWDGLGSGALVGWNAPGHPYKLYEYFAQPYFEVTVQGMDEEGHILYSSAELVKAGERYTLDTLPVEGYTIKSIDGNDQLEAVGKHTTVTITYQKEVPDHIVPLTSEKEQTIIHDLMGRRLKQTGEQGIYLINRKKVLVP